RAVVECFIREGHKVIAVDRNIDVLAEIRTHSSPVLDTFDVDITDPLGCRKVAESVVDRFGSLDILVNSAGVAGRSAPIWDLSDDDWRAVIETNLSGTFFMMRAALPHMRRKGWGRIVNIASIAGKEGNPNASPYSASKAGVIGLTKSVAKEVSKDGILVNCVTPAVIATPMLDQVSREHLEYMVERIPMGRMGQTSEVAELITWLSSPLCSFSTGAVFDISGGRATY
ncbi:MAG TPA: SDR family NAD(P)-dependent oxidoreductase, partial [Acidimicrobiia bacterium]|nr:SDR family NAD(P)-dependent oxidoreductase [Acidimicrobiia bacterium]